MSFWKKNPNEASFAGGQKHWADVIKNTGAPNLLLWKQPEEDFNTYSTLIVMPGETAIFVHRGSIEQVFDTPGTYKLTTENYPFISRLRNQLSGGISTFNCVVYFIRQAHSREINWGIAPAIKVRDPIHGILCKLRTNGAYKISISDPSKFLMHMVGSNKQSFAESELQEYFGNEIQMHIRTLITQFIGKTNVEVLAICQYQVEISILIEPFIRIMLQKYGIELESFSIAVFDVADDDPNRQALETAFAQHAHMRILGEDWARLQAAEILKELAQNPGAGGVASMGAGMGMAMSAAPIFANLAQQMFGNAPAATPQQPPKRPAPFGSGFGGGAGYAPQKEGPSVSSPSGGAFPSFEQSATVEEKPQDMTQFKQSLQQLKYMLDQGFITQEAYDTKISEIMKRM